MWKTEKWILIALLAGLLLMAGVHFYSQKSIKDASAHSELYSRQYLMASKLKDVEKSLLAMEGHMHNYILTGDLRFFREMDRHMLQAQQQVSEVETMLRTMRPLRTSGAFLSFKKRVEERLAHNNSFIDSFRINGPEWAGLHIANGQAQLVQANFSKALQHFLQSEGIDVNEVLEKGHHENDHISNIDNLAFLLGAGLLFFAIAYLLRSLRKRMKLQDHLVTAKEEVERTARIKEQFLANMSHEIRTPLQAILGYTNLLAKEKLTDRQAQYVHNIQLAGENLLSIVNDILDVSKIESGMVRLEELPFSLSGLLHSVDSMFQPKVAEKDIYLRLHPNLKIPSVLIGDPTRLTQILVNLINNAVKFTEKGGIDIFHKITKKTPEKVWLEIQVKDTGVGIAPEKLPHIFDRFEQADSKVTRMYGGSGLGLYIVKQLVEMQGGTISVESEPGRGSVFKVEIPYKVADEKALRANPAPGLVDLAKNFSDLQLLLVEDNLMNQRVVGMFLSGWGIDFDIADNGKSAIQLLEKNKYDLILMDVQMPEMDGYSATEYIRQNMGITTPIIAMTAHAFAGEREKALSYGMNEYISKPIKEEALYKMIARFVPLVREASAPSSTTSPPAAPATTTSNGPAIDYNFLMQSSKGKKEYLKNILELFLQQAPLEVAAMEMALADGRFADVGKTAHSLKSTVGYAGMDDSFRPLLESIEKKARSADNPGQLEPLVRQLKELLNDALLKIREEAMPLTE